MDEARDALALLHTKLREHVAIIRKPIGQPGAIKAEALGGKQNIHADSARRELLLPSWNFGAILGGRDHTDDQRRHGHALGFGGDAGVIGLWLAALETFSHDLTSALTRLALEYNKAPRRELAVVWHARGDLQKGANFISAGARACQRDGRHGAAGGKQMQDLGHAGLIFIIFRGHVIGPWVDFVLLTSSSRPRNPLALTKSRALGRTLPTMTFRSAAAFLCAALVLGAADARAQQSGQRPQAAPPAGASTGPLRPAPGTVPTPGSGRLFLSATFGGSATTLVSGVRWRIFQARVEGNGQHGLVAESNELAPSFTLPDGDYIVHASYGLAAVTRRVVIASNNVNERIPLNAGALKISGKLGEADIQPARLKIDIYVPERPDQREKLVAANLKPDDMIRLPEGTYRIVSTYLDSGVSPSAPAVAGLPANATNSVINAEARIDPGKLTEAIVRHRASNITLKLVNVAGGEALANTSFTVLTPGGDVIREMIGAFPSLVLAEGEYTVIARRDGRTHQMTLKVPANSDREVEVMAN